MSMGRSSRKASSTYPGECPKWPRSVGDRRSRPVLYPPRVKGFGKEGKGAVRDDQTVAEMANEVLLRQAKARADRSGEPIEEAMEAVLNTEAGRQLRELRDGPHGDEGVEEWQVGMARERARQRAEQLGKHLEEPPEHPAHG